MKSKFKILSFIVIILFQISSYTLKAQQLSLQWYNRFGLENWDYVNDFIRLADGNYILTGSLRADINTDSIQSSASNNGWFASVDSNGSVLWQKTFKGKEFETVTSVTENSQNIIIAGIFQDSTSIDSITIISDSYMSGFYAFIDTTGNVSNLKRIGEKGEFKNVLLCSNNLNRSYIAGLFTNELTVSSVTYSDKYGAIFFGELNLAGNILDPQFIKCSGNLTLTSSQCNDSLIFIAGSYSDTLFIADSSMVSSGGTDAFIVCLNNGGELKWIQTISGNGNQQINDFTLAADGKISLTGYFENNAFLNTYVLQTYGSKDMLLALLDIEGNYLWCKNIGSVSNDQGFSITMNNDYDIFVSGSFTHIIGLPDEYGNIVQLESSSPFGNSFIAKYSEAGILKASYTLPGTSEDYCQGVEVDNSGKITAVGNFYQTLTLQVLDGEFIEINSHGDKDIFMLHFDDLCKDFEVNAGNDTLMCPNQSLYLIPKEEYSSFIWEPGGEADEYLEVFQAGEFYITATNEYGCISKDSLFVSQGILPTVYAGADTIIEPGQQLDILLASGSDSNDWSWNTSGDGYFGNPWSLQTYYTPSYNDISDGNIILSLTGSNVCGMVSDSLSVSFLLDDDGVSAYPNPSSGLVTLICEEGQTIQSVTVTNQTGYVFISEQIINNYYYSFNLSSYPPGTYLFYITTNNTLVTKVVNKI